MINAQDINEKTPWQDLTPGGEIYEAGTARAFNTGVWRTNTPVFMPKPVNTACFAFPSARTVLFQSKTANAWILIICIARAAAFVKMFVHSRYYHGDWRGAP